MQEPMRLAGFCIPDRNARNVAHKLCPASGMIVSQNPKGSNLFFSQLGHRSFCDCVARLKESVVKIWNQWIWLLA
ncbi:hypothetical protein Rcae01_00555 [Novipirellula caenicola]|uniref:Uncharacterized protein n=1 Tax=Novipirellula caenicola TaxID=1536901 RepID=A0ABP9VIS6_9BACT